MNILRPLTLLLMSAGALLLAACGGATGDDDAKVRLINATTEYASLDLYTEDDKINDAIATDAAGDYVGVSAEEQTFKITRAGSSSALLSFDRTVAADTTTSFLAYTTGESLRVVSFGDDEDEPSSGYAKLRVFNASTEAGSLDVYLTTADTSLSEATASASAVEGERFSAYTETGKGSYRIRVTANGDKTDLRLDIPEITLADQQVATLVLGKTTGGTLVHGLLVNQEGTVQAYRNSNARVRLVAGVTESGVVSAMLNGTSISAGLRSPAVGSYVLVPAGSVTANLQLDGNSLAAGALTLTAGADASLAVLGTPTTPTVALIADDNRPSTNSANARIRLVNGVVGLDAAVTLTADYSSVATDVSFAQASEPTSVTANTNYRLEATSPAAAAALYLSDEVSLQATRVYTLFMLGDSTSPVGVLRRDR